MGYLTTITIYNDNCDQILKNKKEFAEKCYDACMPNKTNYFGIGCACNMVKCQRPRHADEFTMYVHSGNTVTEINPYCNETANLMKNHEKFFEEILQQMEDNLKSLKKQYKDY